MARRIGDDELAFLSREESVCDVDRDALFAFGGKTVDEQRKVDFLALRADALAIRLERGQLILEYHFTVVE